MNKWYINGFVIMNEYMLHTTAICAFLFTGFVYRPESRAGLGNLWLALILFPLVLDGMFLWGYSFLKLKWAAELYIKKRQYAKVRAELIKSGKLVIKKQLTDKEKAILNFKAKQAKARARQKKEVRRVLKEKRRQIQAASQSEDSSLYTPQFTSGELSMRRKFDEIYANDETDEQRAQREYQ